jgi:hypothetical protein
VSCSSFQTFAYACGKCARLSVGGEVLEILVDDIQDEHLYLKLDYDLDGTEALTVRFIDIMLCKRKPLHLFIIASLTTQQITNWKLCLSTKSGDESVSRNLKKMSQYPCTSMCKLILPPLVNPFKRETSMSE